MSSTMTSCTSTSATGTRQGEGRRCARECHHDRMKVLLISCYELGHQPLHVASAAAFLRAAGHEVSAVDLSVQTLDEVDLDAPELVAVAVPMHTAMRMAVPVARAVRARRGLGVRLVLFGLYAPLCGPSLEPG